MRAFNRLLGLLVLTSLVIAPAAFAQAGSSPAWEATTTARGLKVAMFRSNGPIRGVSIACQGSTPMLMLAVSLSSRNSRANLELASASGGTAVIVPMVRNTQTGAWMAPLGDRAALDLLAGSSSNILMTLGGAKLGSIPLTGSSNAIRTALAGCYVVAANAMSVGSAGTTDRAVFVDSSLPPVVRRDLTDFDQSCAAPEPFREDLTPKGRGVGLAAPGAISRADFNGDGVADFALETGKLRCSRALKDGFSGRNRLFIYSSMVDGKMVHSLDVPIDRFAITQGRKASLRIHLKAVTDDIEGSSHPEISELLTMTSATKWSQSKVATPDWRQGELDRYPDEVRSWFGDLDRRCAAADRRLTGVQDSIFPKNATGRGERVGKIDFNADGMPDYIVDTDNLNCGMFFVAPKAWPKPCGSNCVLVAFVSKPGGGYAISPVPGFQSFNGNGDPDYLGKFGNRDVICGLHSVNYQNENATTYRRYSWTGTTGQRVIVRKGQGCG